MIKNIALVYRSGGPDYNLEYVRRLVEDIRKHGGEYTKIWCLSDDSSVREFCHHIPLKTDWPGWWSKLELFMNFDNCLYFDLDTVIRGSIKPLLEHDHSFTMLSDFYLPELPGSGVMAWEGDYSFIPIGFDLTKAKKYRTRQKWGDQGWITERLKKDPERFQKIFPGLIGSYKAGYIGCSVVCFHGKPRPRDVGWKV